MGSPSAPDVPDWVCAAVVFGSDLLGMPGRYLTECVQTGEKASRSSERKVVRSRLMDPDKRYLPRGLGRAPRKLRPIVRSLGFFEVARGGESGRCRSCAL